MTPSRALFAALALLPAAPAPADASLACEQGIVHMGDTRVDLMGKCGDPAVREVDELETGLTLVQGNGLGMDGDVTSTTLERWTFNFGPDRFVQVVTLHGGRVTRIESGSYGYPAGLLSSRRDQPCESFDVRVGDRKLDLLAKCGEPTARDVRREKRARSAATRDRDTTAIAYTTVTVETWTYDLGPSRFITIATLEHGRVTAVEHGGYGYRRGR
ncbi:MAG: DUF2845 domain-containing protein [Anaeromyxobacter sp.]